jgi:uncharacterized ubiquitin-like protein YukD
MKKHGIVTVDFEIFGGKRYDLKVPFDIPVKVLIFEIAKIYGYAEIIRIKQYQSFKAILTSQIIQGSMTLEDANIKEGEILYIKQ